MIFLKRFETSRNIKFQLKNWLKNFYTVESTSTSVKKTQRIHFRSIFGPVYCSNFFWGKWYLKFFFRYLFAVLLSFRSLSGCKFPRELHKSPSDTRERVSTPSLYLLYSNTFFGCLGATASAGRRRSRDLRGRGRPRDTPSSALLPQRGRWRWFGYAQRRHRPRERH